MKSNSILIKRIRVGVYVSYISSYVITAALIALAIKTIYIPITFNNPLKASFFYPFTIQTQPTQIVKVYFLLKNRFNRFLKIIDAQNQLSITLCSDFVCNKTLDVKNLKPTHTNF